MSAKRGHTASIRELKDNGLRTLAVVKIKREHSGSEWFNVPRTSATDTSDRIQRIKLGRQFLRGEKHVLSVDLKEKEKTRRPVL